MNCLARKLLLINPKRERSLRYDIKRNAESAFRPALSKCNRSEAAGKACGLGNIHITAGAFRNQIVAAVGGLHFSVERVLIRKIMQQQSGQESVRLNCSNTQNPMGTRQIFVPTPG